MKQKFLEALCVNNAMSAEDEPQHVRIASGLGIFFVVRKSPEISLNKGRAEAPSFTYTNFSHYQMVAETLDKLLSILGK